MRKATWSAAAVIVLFGAVIVLGSPMVRAADTVTMGSDSEPNAFKFFPAEVVIPVGSTVVWENKSPYVQHDAAAKNGTFKSPLLGNREKFEFKFTAPGDYEYICTVPGHEGAGMTGVVRVTGGAAAPAPAPAPAPTPTTQAGSSGAGATTTTSRAGQPTTTMTTAKNAAGSGSTTTTTAGGADPGVTTSSGPATTPTSAPDVAGATSTTAGHGAEEAAAGDHGSGGAADEEQKSSPVGIAFAGISTLILLGVSAKLLGS